MRKLYCLEGQYQCRKCGNLAYYSQRLRPSDRLRYKSNEIRSTIENRGGRIEYSRYHGHKKPPRMHNKTFEQLKDKSFYYRAKSDVEGFKELGQWHPKFTEFFEEYFRCEAHYIVEDYEQKKKNDH